MRCEEGVAENCLETIERIVVEQMEWMFRRSIRNYWFTNPSRTRRERFRSSTELLSGTK